MGYTAPSYLNRSPRDSRPAASGSPLRQKSPYREPLASMPPASSRGHLAEDPNMLRMKKSVERIAAVLGIKDDGQRPGTHSKQNSQPQMPQGSPTRPGPNFNNPSAIRALQPPKNEDLDGQPSGYKSLREKSPYRKSLSPTRGESQPTMGGGDQGATKFASVSKS